MSPPTTPDTPNAGFTLIEILVSLLITASVAAIIAAAMPRSTQASQSTIAANKAAMTTEQLTDAIQSDFANAGSFAAFSDASAQQFTAIFTRGSLQNVTAQADFAQATTLTAPGINASVGDLLFVTDGTLAKVVRVTNRSGDTYTHECRNGVSGLNARVARATTLSLQANGTNTYRNENQAGWTLASTGSALTFTYGYKNVNTGQINQETNGTVGKTGASIRTGLFLTAQTQSGTSTRTTQDRRVMVPLRSTTNLTVLNCDEGIAATPTENTLKVTVRLPLGLSAGNVQATGPGVNANFGTTRNFAPLQTGTYTVTAQSVNTGTYTFTPSVSGAPVSITGRRQSAFTLVNYQAVTGAINAQVSGLPAGTSATITFSGPGTLSDVVPSGGSRVMGNVQPGVYSVSAAPITVSGVTYSVSSAPTFLVRAGVTSSVMVAYAPVGSPGGGGGGGGTGPGTTTGTGTVKITIKDPPYTTVKATSNLGQTINIIEGTQTFTVPSGPGKYVNMPIVGVNDTDFTPEPGSAAFDLADGQVLNLTFTYRNPADNGGIPPTTPPPASPPPGEDQVAYYADLNGNFLTKEDWEKLPDDQKAYKYYNLDEPRPYCTPGGQCGVDIPRIYEACTPGYQPGYGCHEVTPPGPPPPEPPTEPPTEPTNPAPNPTPVNPAPGDGGSTGGGSGGSLPPSCISKGGMLICP